MNNDKLVSVLLCFYNRENFLYQAIESILNQTYKNIEFIIVNDGSNDLSDQVVNKFNDKRIKYIKNSKNKGIVYSYNKAVELSRGFYIAIMDSDDISEPNRIEEQIIFLNKKNIDVCGTQTLIFGDGNNKVPSHCLENDNDIKTIMLFGNPMAHPTILAKSKIYKKYQYSSKYPVCLDYYLWTKMALGDVKFGNVKKILLRHRWHTDQYSQKKNLQGLIEAKHICNEYALNCKGIEYQVKSLKKIELGYKQYISFREFMVSIISLSNIIKKNKANKDILKIFIKEIFVKIIPMVPKNIFLISKICIREKIKFNKNELLYMYIQSFLFISYNSKLFLFIKKIFKIKNTLI